MQQASLKASYLSRDPKGKSELVRGKVREIAHVISIPQKSVIRIIATFIANILSPRLHSM